MTTQPAHNSPQSVQTRAPHLIPPYLQFWQLQDGTEYEPHDLAPVLGCDEPTAFKAIALWCERGIVEPVDQPRTAGKPTGHTWRLTPAGVTLGTICATIIPIFGQIISSRLTSDIYTKTDVLAEYRAARTRIANIQMYLESLGILRPNPTLAP
jgi:hypothetical protein